MRVWLAGLLLTCHFLASCQTIPDTPNTAALKAASVAMQMRGMPYRYGGSSPKGFDCSGLVWYSYRQAGVNVPRTTRDLRKAVTRVPRNKLLPGDLVFFRGWIRTGHVGIYTGSNSFVHAPSSGKKVSLDRIDNGYWHDHFRYAGRLLE